MLAFHTYTTLFPGFHAGNLDVDESPYVCGRTLINIWTKIPPHWDYIIAFLDFLG